MAAAAAVLVVGRARRGRGRAPLPQPVACLPVLRRRLRDARRGLHLERHHRPRSRRAGRAHALAPDPVGQALVGLLVLVQFNRFTILVGIASLAIVAIYPLAKRVTWWPQIVLGLAFSWGALMGWAAVFSRLDTPALLLYAGSIAWVIGYDTIYAHQDREDDALIGVKSTARLFGQRTRLALLCFYALAVVLIGISGAAAGAGPVFVIGCVFFGAHLGWQIERLDIDDPDLCLKLFKSNRDAGLILFAALIGDALYNSYFF
jgi:4-hydroxybenzoate polyprenyltransferase